MSLIQRQDAALAAMHEPRSSAKRHAKLHRAVLRRYQAAAVKLGYSAAEIAQQVRDIRDVYALQCAADEEAGE